MYLAVILVGSISLFFFNKKVFFVDFDYLILLLTTHLTKEKMIFKL